MGGDFGDRVVSALPAGRNIGHRYFVEIGQRTVDGGEILFHDIGALACVGPFCLALDRRDGLVARQYSREREKAGLQDGIDARAKAEVKGDLGCVDHEQFQFLVDQLLLHVAWQFVPDPIGPVGTVDKYGGLGCCGAEHVLLEQKVELVYAHEARGLEQIGCADGLRSEAQVRDRRRARLLRVVHEVALRVPTGVVGKNSYGVLVGAYRAVGTQPVEQGAHVVRRLDVERRIDREAGVRHVVVDADRKAVLWIGLLQFVEHRFRHGRIEILRRQSVAPADQLRHRRPFPPRWRERRWTRTSR